MSLPHPRIGLRAAGRPADVGEIVKGNKVLGSVQKTLHTNVRAYGPPHSLRDLSGVPVDMTVVGVASLSMQPVFHLSEFFAGVDTTVLRGA